VNSQELWLDNGSECRWVTTGMCAGELCLATSLLQTASITATTHSV